ncbi:hypothetical protein VB005_00356 [Metarhizium brunneum]
MSRPSESLMESPKIFALDSSLAVRMNQATPCGRLQWHSNVEKVGFCEPVGCNDELEGSVLENRWLLAGFSKAVLFQLTLEKLISGADVSMLGHGFLLAGFETWLDARSPEEAVENAEEVVGSTLENTLLAGAEDENASFGDAGLGEPIRCDELGSFE